LRKFTPLYGVYERTKELGKWRGTSENSKIAMIILYSQKKKQKNNDKKEFRGDYIIVREF